MKHILPLLLLVSFPAYAKETACMDAHHHPRPFREYYAEKNHRSIKQGFQLWGGPPDTPNDSDKDVITRMGDSFSDYIDCLNKHHSHHS